MADIPDQTPTWAPIPLIEKSDSVLGGMGGAANRQAIALAHRTAWIQQNLAELTTAATTAQSAADTAQAQAQSAAFDAYTAQQQAESASGAAAAASTKADTAQTAASAADGKAVAAQAAATAAATAASTAATAASAKATRVDLGAVTLSYTAALILGAGARSIEVTCTGAKLNDALFVVSTSAIPDGYAVGAAQCLVVDKVRVSVVHPALALGANFTIPLRVFALR